MDTHTHTHIIVNKKMKEKEQMTRHTHTHTNGIKNILVFFPLVPFSCWCRRKKLPIFFLCDECNDNKNLIFFPSSFRLHNRPPSLYNFIVNISYVFFQPKILLILNKRKRIEFCHLSILFIRATWSLFFAANEKDEVRVTVLFETYSNDNTEWYHHVPCVMKRQIKN